MDEVLRGESHKWDANGDGFIDLKEFKAYYRARAERERAAEAAAGPKPGPAPGGTDLPPGLPAWFQEYDTDHDGQVGLYEWKAARQPIARFLEMDANGDGFLTPDEVLWATHAEGAPSPPAPRK